MDKTDTPDERGEIEREYEEKMLSFDELKPKLGITYSKAHIRRLIARRRFPAPIYTSQRGMLWPVFVLKKWIRDMAEEATNRDRPLRTIEEYRKA